VAPLSPRRVPPRGPFSASSLVLSLSRPGAGGPGSFTSAQGGPRGTGRSGRHASERGAHSTRHFAGCQVGVCWVSGPPSRASQSSISKRQRATERARDGANLRANRRNREAVKVMVLANQLYLSENQFYIGITLSVHEKFEEEQKRPSFSSFRVREARPRSGCVTSRSCRSVCVCIAPRFPCSLLSCVFVPLPSARGRAAVLDRLRRRRARERSRLGGMHASGARRVYTRHQRRLTTAGGRRHSHDSRQRRSRDEGPSSDGRTGQDARRTGAHRTQPTTSWPTLHGVLRILAVPPSRVPLPSSLRCCDDSSQLSW
jgi:hypothetical protein